MHFDRDRSIVYSPTDLTLYAASPFASWMERLRREDPDHPALAARDDESEELRLVAAEGDRHEARYLQALRAEERDVVEIPKHDDAAEELTRRALAAGNAVIYQACLVKPPFRGFSDFLRRADDPALGGPPVYDVVDTKLARSPKPYFLLQLACYAELLEAMTGRRPPRLRVVLGSNETRTWRTDDFFYAYLALKEEFLAFQRDFDPARPPEPDPTADHGRYESAAAAWAEARDHLVRVAGITKGQIKKLTTAGVTTLTALAETSRARIPRLEDVAFRRLRDQARLQRRAAANPPEDPPPFELVPPDPAAPGRGLAALPPASPLDVYADFEGYPLVEGGLEYLFGAVVHGPSGLDFHDWWAHDRASEKQAFGAFVDFLTDRRRRDPGMHVYHYAPYEPSALKRLAGRHGAREAALDDLLRANVFVDLYRVVRQGLRVGAPSYSIKKIERLYRPPRASAVATAGDSIVAYHEFLASGEAPDWRRSERLRQIRDYNRDDCVSTAELAAWLRARQAEFVAGSTASSGPVAGDVSAEARSAAASEHEDPAEAESPRATTFRLRDELAARLIAAAESFPEDSPERVRRELPAHWIGFHRREEKPQWWAHFERSAMTSEQLAEDAECLGGCSLQTSRPVGRGSAECVYAFDAEQDTKLDSGSEVRLLSGAVCGAAKLELLDRAAGRAVVRIGPRTASMFPGGVPPATAALLPGPPIKTETLQTALAEIAETVAIDDVLPPALEDLMLRRRPRLTGDQPNGAAADDSAPLLRPGEDALVGARRLALSLDRSALCVQGPPGAGKTFTGAHMILALARAGRRVGVVANSHHAVENLLRACVEEAGGSPPRILKVGGADRDDEVDSAPFARAESRDAEDLLARHDVVGGTAWFFARPGVIDAFDTLFVDEAGQFSFANLAAVARCARNLVLLGDQMQLGQPTQGVHPGASGLSALEYFLRGQAVVPADRGLFLAETWRLHPAICRFISGAVYENRLRSRAGTERRTLPPRGDARYVRVEAGLVPVSVPHEGNTQESEEEVEAVRAVYAELLGRPKRDREGNAAGVVGVEDVLVVAPYNRQVRRLRDALPAGARVGSVDLFQGQEADAVIVSMCASDPAGSPRGLDFLLDRRRLNVAISRARSIAVVVGSPALASARGSTVEQLALVNTYCRALRGE